jgi:5'-3' exonuclease
MILIDGDIIAWRTGTKKFNAKENDFRVYFNACSMQLQKIISTLEDNNFTIFLSGKQIKNFRTIINPEYKLNRKDIVKPQSVVEIEYYLQDIFNTKIIHGYEADDALGWNQTDTSIICTIDKDLDMIPGMHYNFVHNKLYYISELQALQFFYKQMLIGDNIDNIKGVNGIGLIKADKIIKNLQTEQEMFDIVYKLYNNPKRFVINACCLWILRNKGELWVNRQNLILPNQCKQEVDQMLEFMKSLNLII